jgi:hypothetical protein
MQPARPLELLRVDVDAAGRRCEAKDIELAPIRRSAERQPVAADKKKAASSGRWSAAPANSPR